MEPNPLPVVLALTLACTGGMFLLIARQINGRAGMSTFAIGLALFGLVFAVPDSVYATAGLLVRVALDSLAVAAVLLVLRGLQRFMHRRTLSGRQLIAAVGGYAVVVVLAWWLGTGRHAADVLQDLTLGVLFLWLASTAAREARRDNPELRKPLIVMAVVLAALALISLARGVDVLTSGAQPGPAGAAEAWIEAFVMLSVLLLGPNLLWMHSVQLGRQLGELATRDPLTLLLNENGLDDVLQRHFARRHREPVTLMHVDVDHFKRVNDLHGEDAGDDVLRMIALALESTLRAGDFVARVGGEEFVVCCISDEPAKAAILGERLRAAVQAIQTGLTAPEGRLRVSVSVGISQSFGDLDHWRQAWAEAETALGAAKEAGGNCVVHPTSAPTAPM